MPIHESFTAICDGCGYNGIYESRLRIKAAGWLESGNNEEIFCSKKCLDDWYSENIDEVE